MEKSVTEGIFPGMAGLFSPVGTEQIQRLQAAGQPVDPLQAVSGSMGFLGERMRQGIGSAFGQMPQQDRKRQVFQQLVQQLGQQGVDTSTADGMVQLAQKLSSMPGFEGEALGLRQRAAQMAQQQRMTGLEEQLKMAQTEKARAEAEKAGRETTGIKVNAEFLKLVAPNDRARVIQAAQNGQPIPTDINFVVDPEKTGTEFERMIAGLPPDQQAELKRQYIEKKVSREMPPAMVNTAIKEGNDLNSIAFGAADVAESISNLRSGKLQLGLSDNFLNSLKTLAGRSDEGSKAYSQFSTALETLRNARLNLNTGVQTEGDALRAANEFLANYDRYDTKTALSQLERVFTKMKNAYDSKQKRLKTLYTTSGTAIPDTFFNPFPEIVESGVSQKRQGRSARAAAAQQPQQPQQPESAGQGSWRIINVR